MSATALSKKDAADLEAQMARVRKQFGEQTTFVETRTTGKVELLSDLQEYFKRRAEIEITYATSLDKLADRIVNKRVQTTRREPTSTQNLLASLLVETKKEARERHQLYDLFSGEFCQKLDAMVRDVQQISRRIKEVVVVSQEDLKKSFAKLSEDFRSYVAMSLQTADAEDKLKKTKDKTMTLISQDSRASIRRKKYEGKASKAGETLQVAKKRQCMSRNKYLLSLASSNNATDKYFNKELQDLFEVLDYDYHDGLQRLYELHVNSQLGFVEELQKSLSTLEECQKRVSFDADKYKLMEDYSSAFSPPGSFPQLRFQDDNVGQLSLQDGASEEKGKFKTLKEKLDRCLKSVEEEEKAFVFVKETMGHKKLGYEDAVPTSAIEDDPSSPPYLDNKGKTASLDRGGRFPFGGKHERTVSGNYFPESSAKSLSLYLEKFQKLKQYQMELYHLEGEKTLWDKVMDGEDVDDFSCLPPIKLFESDLEQYIETVSEPIPLIIRSCTTHLETYGTTVEGIFRVPGPQALIEELKEDFEKGEDPLSSEPHSRDIHAVASVMKEYFRKLTNSLFPVELYETVVQHGRIDLLQIRIEAVRQTIYRDLPPSIINVMRYLFFFLNRLAKSHEQTRMNSSNLAMVFGPTLTRPPIGRDALAQAQEVVSINTIMQTCIDHCEKIFDFTNEEDQLPSLPEAEETAPAEAEGEATGEEEEDMSSDSEDILSEFETIEVRAVHDYLAKSESEITFKKGDLLHAIQLTDDGSWYDGLSGRKRGYIPAKYVEVVPLSPSAATCPISPPPLPPPPSSAVEEKNPATATAAAEEEREKEVKEEEEEEAKEDDMNESLDDLDLDEEKEKKESTPVDTTSLEAAEAELAQLSEGLDDAIRKSSSAGALLSPTSSYPPPPPSAEEPIQRRENEVTVSAASLDDFPPPPPKPELGKTKERDRHSLPDAKVLLVGETKQEEQEQQQAPPQRSTLKRSSLSPTGPAPHLFEGSGKVVPPQIRPKPPRLPEKSPLGVRKTASGSVVPMSKGGSLPSTPVAGNIFGQIVGATREAPLPPAGKLSAEGLLKDRPMIKAKPLAYAKSVSKGGAPAPPAKPVPFKKPVAGSKAAATIAQQAALAAEAHKSRIRKQNAERDLDDEEGVTHL